MADFDFDKQAAVENEHEANAESDSDRTEHEFPSILKPNTSASKSIIEPQPSPNEL